MVLMNRKDWIDLQLKDDNFMFRLANISGNQIGLPMMIWIDVKEDGVNESPRLIFTDKATEYAVYGMVPITLDRENPEIMIKDDSISVSDADLEALRKWITVYYIELMKVWNGEISHCKFIIQLLSKIKTI